MARSLVSDNSLINSGTLIEDFDSLTGWAPYGAQVGTYELDTTHIIGTGAGLKLNCTAENTVNKMYKYNASGINCSATSRFQIAIYMHNQPPPGMVCYVVLSSDAAGSFANAKTWTLGGSVSGSFKKGMNCVAFAKGDESITAGSINYSSVKNVMVQLFSPTGYPSNSCTFDKLYFGRANRPSILWNLDDCHGSQYSAFSSHFQPYKIYPSYQVTSDLIDNPTYITSAQLQELQASGCSINIHAQTHTALTSLTQAGVESELTTCMDFLRSLGITGYRLGSYPTGAFNDTVIAACENVGLLAMRSLQAAQDTVSGDTVMPSGLQQEQRYFGVAHRHKINSMGLGASVSAASVITEIRKAVTRQADLFIYAHTFVSSGAAGPEYNLTDVATINTEIVRLRSQGLIDTPNYEEWYEKVTFLE